MTKRSKSSESSLDLTELKITCAMCKKKAVRAFRPFCSKRCKDIDLGNWFTGAYVIAGEDADAKETETPLGEHALNN